MSLQRGTKDTQKGGNAAVAAAEKARVSQAEADVAYQAALVAEKAEVALLEGGAMRENIQSMVGLLRCQALCIAHLEHLGSASTD